VVHRLDVDDLPFRYVGKHRRTTFREVVAPKARIDAQMAAIEGLADDPEDLKQRGGVEPAIAVFRRPVSFTRPALEISSSKPL